MVNNLRDFFKKHLAACDPVIAKLISGMNTKKKPSSLALEVKRLLLNPDPKLNFAMFVGNIDDFAYSDDENEEEAEESDSDLDSDDAGLEGQYVAPISANDTAPQFEFSPPLEASQSTESSSQNTDSQSTMTSTQTPESSQELIPSSQ